MDVLSLSDAPWRHAPSAVVVILGLALVWRGLLGGPSGERGLLRRRADALGRVEGWRLSVLGLALTGLGAAWAWEAWWLFYLALGIGFVEVLEASAVIAAWRWDGGRTATDTRPTTASGTHRGQPGGRWRPLVG